MGIPTRKCLNKLKMTIVLILVIAVLGIADFVDGNRRQKGDAAALVGDEYWESEYERLIAEDEQNIVMGLGEGGIPSVLSGPDESVQAIKSLEETGVNVPLSNRISYSRTLKDVRDDACKKIKYDAELPSVSVVIIFRNEPYSMLLRTIWSVLNSVKRRRYYHKYANLLDKNGSSMNLGYKGQDPNDPFLYIKEIILVDDNSTMPELKEKLSYYISTRLPSFVQILRLHEHLGLIKARLAGARYSTGDVLVFLDAHCETQRDWLRPLLQRIKDGATGILVPVIDMINPADLRYGGYGSALMEVDWTHWLIGDFKFSDGCYDIFAITPREVKRRGSNISATWSPTMAGGLFAVKRAYFWSIGGYDEQMTGWGGENLEMSFRIWQCGGTIEIMPCSRVGHVERINHAHGYNITLTHRTNMARTASVWMDDYAELFFLHVPNLRDSPAIGDLSDRKRLRKKLKCKSFDWYLKHVLMDKYVPIRDSVAFGRFRNPATGLCLIKEPFSESKCVGLAPCSDTLAPQQQISVSHSGQLRDEYWCVTALNSTKDNVRKLTRIACSENANVQEWRILETGQIRHELTGYCLSVNSTKNGSCLSLVPCVDDDLQKWTQDLSITPDGEIHCDSNIVTASQIKNLKRLIKLRPKSQQENLSDDDHKEPLVTPEESQSHPSTTPIPQSLHTFPVSSYPKSMIQATEVPIHVEVSFV